MPNNKKRTLCSIQRFFHNDATTPWRRLAIPKGLRKQLGLLTDNSAVNERVWSTVKRDGTDFVRNELFELQRLHGRRGLQLEFLYRNMVHALLERGVTQDEIKQIVDKSIKSTNFLGIYY